MLFIILSLIVVFLIIYYFIKTNENLNYLKNKGIKHIKPLPFVGNILPLVTGKESLVDLISRIYNNFPNERYCGFYQFGKPILIIKDIELIKSITIKHFDHFADHVGYVQGENDLWGKALFASKGERWHDLRQTMSPVFTSSKMRVMFSLMNECCHRFTTYFKEQNTDLIEVEMKDLASRFANDVIASAAFGISLDSLTDKNHDFLKTGRELVDFSGINKYKFIISTSYPRLARLLNVKIVSDRVENFFKKIILENLKTREENKIVRPDLIHLLMMARQGKLKYEEVMGLDAGFAVVEESDLGKSSKHTRFLTDSDITAQALIFFFGGFDTVSTGLSFTCYELAVNPDIQERLRQEIYQTHEENNKNITYEKLASMKYLDMVISESFRMWTQGIILDRQCTKDFVIKAEKPGERDVVIKAGESLYLPVWPIHHDPKYFPNPEKFHPERFSDENKHNIKSGTYMPFGVGPRNCIGSRFAILETKIFLYYLLMDFELVPTKSTVIPIQVKKSSFSLNAEGGIHLGLKQLVK